MQRRMQNLPDGCKTCLAHANPAWRPAGWSPTTRRATSTWWSPSGASPARTSLPSAWRQRALRASGTRTSAAACARYTAASSCRDTAGACMAAWAHSVAALPGVPDCNSRRASSGAVSMQSLACCCGNRPASTPFLQLAGCQAPRYRALIRPSTPAHQGAPASRNCWAAPCTPTRACHDAPCPTLAGLPHLHGPFCSSTSRGKAWDRARALCYADLPLPYARLLPASCACRLRLCSAC